MNANISGGEGDNSDSTQDRRPAAKASKCEDRSSQSEASLRSVRMTASATTALAGNTGPSQDIHQQEDPSHGLSSSIERVSDLLSLIVQARQIPDNLTQQLLDSMLACGCLGARCSQQSCNARGCLGRSSQQLQHPRQLRPLQP